MAINGKFGPRFVRRGLLFLFLLTRVSYGGTSSGQIRSVAISPDGKLIAVDFGKESTSFIYRVDVETGKATRLTKAKTGAESSPAFSPDGKRIAYSYSPADGAPSGIVIGNADG
jgi:TolB protein